MSKRSRYLLWLRRVAIVLVALVFFGWMGHWYLQIQDANDRVAAENMRLETFIAGQSAMQQALAAKDYRTAITTGLALQGTIDLTDDETVNLLGLEGFAYFNLADSVNGTARLTDLIASRDAYEAALAGLNGVEDLRYASICASLGGVYYSLADFGDRTTNLQIALAYYKENATFSDRQDDTVTVTTYTMMAYINDALRQG